MKRWLFAVLVLLVLTGCKKAESQASTAARPASVTLHVYALQSFRSSGLEGVIIPEFEKKHNCEVKITLFADRDSLAAAIKSAPEAVDVALGIDNGLAAEHDLLPCFKTHQADELPTLNRECLSDASYRLIPYAYSYVALLYNSRILDDAPQSFGEMQDARHFRQIALLNPRSSAWGTAFMHYVIALFGEEGYEHLLSALRKNIFRSYDAPEEALNAVQNGECSMMFAMFSTAAWIKEIAPAENKLRMQVLKEGSYLYTENIGTLTTSSRQQLALEFTKYVLGDSAQKMLLYKSGLLPANNKVMLPQHYSNLPLAVYTHNERLSRESIREHHLSWLESWERLFSFM